jgi:signal transduction histidine kinase
MTASYVLVTAAVVLLAEGIGLGLIVPQIQSQDALIGEAQTTATIYADKIGGGAATTGDLRLPTGGFGEPGVLVKPGDVAISNKILVVPLVEGKTDASAPMTVGLVVSKEGVVMSSSYPARYPVGASPGKDLPQGWLGGGSGIGAVREGKVAWATSLIFPLYPDSGKPGKGPGPNGAGVDKSKLLGFVYVQAPLQPAVGPSPAALGALIQTGLLILALTIPVGLVFGILTTRGAVRRLRRLADGTVGFAEGDFSARVPESGSDEVAQLERHFNQMAGRLQESIAEQRALAERNARMGERSRISRELHDSISQDLFSLSTLAGGLKKALPASSRLQPQLAVLNTTVGSMIQEMRALLLELRPTALDEKGLLPALEDLCEAYEERVGVRVVKELERVNLDPAGEHAVFRVAQEGLANAARHAEAGRIELSLRPSAGGAELVVADDGRGFDQRRSPSRHGLGLKLMAERIHELGGSVSISSRPGKGTRLRVSLPALQP